MKECRPVTLQSGAFNFCKYTIAIIFWLALIFQNKALVLVGFVILVIAAILKVKKSPLVFFYTHTFERLFPTKNIVIDENSVFFAHKIGAIISGIALVFLYFISPFIGFIITGILAVLKTSGALGFCGAMKLYSCLNNPNGKCCRVGNKVKKYNCG